MCYSLWYNAPTMLSATDWQHRGCIIILYYIILYYIILYYIILYYINYVVLTYLLHVSTCKIASCRRYIQRRRSTANSVKDEGVWS